MQNVIMMKRKFLLLIIVIAIAALALPGPVAAINIVMNFNSGSSAYPSYDPNGSKLIALMNSVEDYYEDIFEASGTLTVDFYYSNIDSLAVHNNTGTSGGHPTSCRIRVDTNRTWFFDETPFNDSEFNMTQTLAGSISNLGDYYDGTVPDLLEYAYKGNDNGTGPAESSNGHDLWCILLHEMGHGLGMTGNCAWWETFWDDDYDLDSDWVWGNSMAVDCYSSDNRYHLAARTNMYPYVAVGARRMPSATDLFAISAAGGWGDMDLMRKDFYSSSYPGNLNAHSCWSGNWKPDSTEDAWVRDGGPAALTDNLTVNNFYVSGSSTVRTGAYIMRADRDCVVGNGSSDTGTVQVQANGEFQVDWTLTVKDGSTILMDATTSLLDVGTLDIRDGASLTGAGTIDIEDGFDLGGVLTTSGGDLTISSLVPIDFDSADGAAVYVTGGDLSCNVALTDAMSTYVEVGATHCLTMDQGWRLNGELFLDGGPNSSTRASIGGGLFRVAGTVEVSRQGRFFCTAEFESAADVELTDSDDVLLLYDDTVVRAGATFTGAGRFYMTSLGELTLDDGVVIGSRLHTNGVVTVEEGDVGEATVNSAYTMNGTATLFVEVDDDDSCDLLDVNAAVTLDGELIIDFIDGYTPADGDSFTVIEYTSRSGMFDDITYTGAFDLIAGYGATALTLTVDYGDSATAVPEPSTLVLLLGVACGLGLVWRKRS